MNNFKSQKAFTLIEVVVTMAVLAIAVGLGVSYIVTQRPRMRVNGDAFAISQSLLKAKTLTVTEHAPFGIAFLTQGAAPNLTFHYFVFRDSDNNGQFTDLDNNPFVQCEHIGDPMRGAPAGTNCAIGGEDPVCQNQYLQLDNANFMVSIFGLNPPNPGSPPIVILFSPLGNVMSPTGAPMGANTIIIQSRQLFQREPRVSYQGGVQIDLASGNNRRIQPSLQACPTCP